MSEKTILTTEIARQFVEWTPHFMNGFMTYTNPIDLEEYDQIEDKAAKIVSSYESDLNLSSLTNLSDAAAESLCQHVGPLNLDGLKTISDAAAESLSRHRGERGHRGFVGVGQVHPAQRHRSAR